MDIAIAGTGYVGLSLAVLLSQKNHVTAVDIIPEKVEELNNWKSPIQDEYIEKYLSEAKSGTRELDLKAVLNNGKEGDENPSNAVYKDADFVVIAAPTNYDSTTQHFDTSAVESVIEQVLWVNDKAFMIIKSTIPVGYTESIRKKYHTNKILFSPEFLRESKALYDNLYPSRIIVSWDANDSEVVNASKIFAGLLKEASLKPDVQVLLMLVNEENQTYKLTDNIYFLRDDTRMTPCLLLQINGRNFPFVDSDIIGDSGKTGYFLLSTAGRCVKLPQKNKGEVSEVFRNGLWSRRGPIYNRSIPLLKKNIFIGAGADNYIMVYPQRNYILDYYLNGGVNSLNVKPHSYYLQVWIQEGFIAFAAVIVFFFWYLFRGISKYRKVTLRNRSGIVGTAIIIGIIGYLIAVIANDSTICTAPVLWTVFGLGWGLEKLDDAEKMG